MMYKVFTQLKHRFPGTSQGNRCGHEKRFAPLPALIAGGQKLQQPSFISKAEKHAHRFFSQHYKKIYSQSPHLRFAIKSKTGVMRSENREKLCIITQAIIRNLDLATMKLKAELTLGEMLRFISFSLNEENNNRRFSPERFFDGLNILRDAGLIHYRIPPAIKLNEDMEKWQAQPAEIAITYRLWNLLGFQRKEVLVVKNKYFDRQQKSTHLINAQHEVLKNRLNRLTKGSFNKSITQTTVNTASPPKHLLSKITTKLCMSYPLEEVKKIITSLEHKTEIELLAYARNLGLTR